MVLTLTAGGTANRLRAGSAAARPPNDATSYDLADFYFGLPSTIALGSNLTTNLRQHVHSLYVQDDWRVTPKLTLNLGLRWEFATPIWDRDNLVVEFRSRHEHSGPRHQWQPVQPRAGESGLQGFRPAPRLGVQLSMRRPSIRAGYGISYSFFNRPGSAIEGINGPLAIFGT